MTLSGCQLIGKTLLTKFLQMCRDETESVVRYALVVKD